MTQDFPEGVPVQPCRWCSSSVDHPLTPRAEGPDPQEDIEGDDVPDHSDAIVDALIRQGLREAQAAELAIGRAEKTWKT